MNTQTNSSGEFSASGSRLCGFPIRKGWVQQEVECRRLICTTMKSMIACRRGLSTSSALKSWTEIPGPKEWPLVGTIPSFIRAGGVETRLSQERDMYFKYGPIFKTNLDEPTVVICDPRDWYQVFRNEGKMPAGIANKVWPFNTYFEELGVRHHTLALDGHAWKENRVRIQKHFFSHADARSYLDSIAPIAQDFSKMAPLYQDDLRGLMSATAFEMIATICYNKRVHAVTDPNGPQADFARLACGMFKACGDILKSPNPLHKMKLSKEWKTFRDNNDKIMKYVQSFTSELEQILEQGRDANPEEYDRVCQSYLGKVLQDPSVKEMISVFVVSLMFAGVDTTSQITGWFLINLAQNQEVQEKLADELKDTLSGRTLMESDLEKHQFPYYKMCFKESMRLTPAGAGTLRTIPVDIALQGYLIPKETMLAYNPTALQRDAQYFDEPLKYMPERWSDEACSARKANEPEKSAVVDHPMIASEFSFGPRMCLGARIAQLEIMAIVTRLIQDYKLEMADPNAKFRVISTLFNEPDPFPRFKLTPRVQQEVFIKLADSPHQRSSHVAPKRRQEEERPQRCPVSAEKDSTTGSSISNTMK
eukprot:TRINITY_DN406_c0_g1_i1.p1 TRINITY_DN406_c0_g1~~TRINITY_DN406_c0_g1_i1.p1  ORF type:complete len:592 (-),score=132.84 TRINITY_DN406_c0_g1_i1:22-1797(-)